MRNYFRYSIDIIVVLSAFLHADEWKNISNEVNASIDRPYLDRVNRQLVVNVNYKLTAVVEIIMNSLISNKVYLIPINTQFKV
jgi:hypothetical protein